MARKSSRRTHKEDAQGQSQDEPAVAALSEGDNRMEEEEEEEEEEQEEEEQEEEEEEEEEEQAEEEEDDHSDFEDGRATKKRKRAATTPRKTKQATTAKAKKSRATKSKVTAASTRSKKRRGQESRDENNNSKENETENDNENENENEIENESGNGTETERKNEAENENEVFEALRDSDAAVGATVADWLTRYIDDAESAQLELFNLLTRAAGCTAVVFADDIAEKEPLAILEGLQDHFDLSEVANYPVASRSKNHRKFRANLVEFFIKMVDGMRTRGFLHDSEDEVHMEFLSNMASWVTAMSSSPVRPFRHTATVVALAMASGMADVAGSLEGEQAVADRMLMGENRRRSSRSDRETGILENLAQSKIALEKCKGFLKDIFDGVFVHRYRDTFPLIRADCMRELGIWITKYPQVFCDAQYLRYIGWVLSDKIASVRQQAVIAFEAAIQSAAETAGRVRDFCERFRDRVLEMAFEDIDDSVRMASLNVVSLMTKHGFLEREQQEKLMNFFLKSRPEETQLRKAIVPFIREWVTEEIINVRMTEARARLRNRLRKEWIELRSWAAWILSQQQLVGSTDLAGLVHMIVSSLHDSVKVFQNWKAIADYLVTDFGGKGAERVDTEDTDENNAEADADAVAEVEGESSSRGNQGSKSDKERAIIYMLTEEEESVMLHLLLLSIRLQTKASVSETVTATSRAKMNTRGSKKADLARADSIIECSTFLAPHLNRLITRLAVEAEHIPVLLQLLREVDFDVFVDLRLTKSYETLVAESLRWFVRESREELLPEFGATFQRLLSFASLQSTTEGLLGEIADECIVKLQQSLDPDNLMEASQEEIHTCRILQKRITTIAGAMDLQSNVAFDTVLKLMRSNAAQEDHLQEIILGCIEICAIMILWTKATDSGSGLSLDPEVFFEAMDSLFEVCDSSFGIKCFVIASDVLVAFSPASSQTSDGNSSSAVYVPSKSAQELYVRLFLARATEINKEKERKGRENTSSTAKEDLLNCYAALIKCCVVGSLDLNVALVPLLLSASSLEREPMFNELARVLFEKAKAKLHEADLEQVLETAPEKDWAVLESYLRSLQKLEKSEGRRKKISRSKSAQHLPNEKIDYVDVAEDRIEDDEGEEAERDKQVTNEEEMDEIIDSQQSEAQSALEPQSPSEKAASAASAKKKRSRSKSIDDAEVEEPLVQTRGRKSRKSDAMASRQPVDDGLED